MKADMTNNLEIGSAVEAMQESIGRMSGQVSSALETVAGGALQVLLDGSWKLGRSRVTALLLTVTGLSMLLSACGPDGPKPPVVGGTGTSPTITETAAIPTKVDVISTAIPAPTEIPLLGYGGPYTAEQKAFTESPRAQEMKKGLEDYVKYWEKFKVFAPGTQLSLLPYEDQTDITNKDKMIYVAEVYNDPNYDGFVVTIPMAQYMRYLETGDPQVMIPPKDATTLMENTDPFKMTKQVKEGSVPALAGIPVGAVNGVQNGEFVYFMPGTAGSLVVVGQLDKNFQWVKKEEAKQYPICQIEQFRDCPVVWEDLFNGDYFRGLKTLSKPFDPAKLKWVPMQLINGPGLPAIVYNTDTAPNYKDASSAPFRRNITSGVTTYQGSDYLIIPIEYADPNDPSNPEKNVWVIGVQYLPIKAREQLGVSVWKNEMNIAPIVTSDQNWADSRQLPLVTKSFEENPKMAEYFQSFLAGSLNALDGKVVQIEIATNTRHWFE